MVKIFRLIHRNRAIVIFGLFIVYWIISSILWSIELEERQAEKEAMVIELLQLRGVEEQDIKAHPEYIAFENERRGDDLAQWIDIPLFLVIMILGIWQLIRSYDQAVRLNKQQRNFLLATSHELKSPLASIKLGIQTLLQRANLDRGRQRRVLINTLEDTERLQTLVENVLLASRMESHDFRLEKKTFDFSAQVRDIYESARSSYAQVRNFEDDITAGINIVGERSATESVVWNLIENAIKYSSDGDTIGVCLKMHDHRTVLLEVSDTGVGIPDKEKEKVFQKFYRVGIEDTRKSKGTGLGLYIIRQVVDMHRGKVMILDNQPKGTMIRIDIPIA